MRWVIDDYLGTIDPGNRDASAHLWGLRRGEQTFRIAVYISGTAMEVDNKALPPDVAQAKWTNGKSVVTNVLSLDEPPIEVMVSTDGVRFSLPD